MLVNSALRGRAPWRSRLDALGYQIAPGPAFPPPASLDGGLVEHVVVPAPAPTRSPATHSDLESIVTAAAEHTRVARAAAQAARPPLTWPSGTRLQDRSDPDESAPALHAAERAEAGAPAAPREDARRVGLIVHAALETWNLRDDGALLEGAHHAARRLAAEQAAVGPARAAAEVSAAAEILSGFLRSALCSRLARAEVLGREVPILHRDASGRTWTGACDLLLREGGPIVVVDYKTDVVEKDAAALAETYRAQIDIYLRAVRAAFRDQDVRGEVWFLRTGMAVRMAPAAT